jgi:hypothetical protein
VTVTVRRNGRSILQELDFGIDLLFGDGWRDKSLCAQLPIAEADALFYPE